MADFCLTSFCAEDSDVCEGPDTMTGVHSSRKLKEMWSQLLACTWPPSVERTLVVTNVIDADGTVRPLLHFASFIGSAGQLSVHTRRCLCCWEPSYGIFTQHHDWLPFLPCHTQTHGVQTLMWRAGTSVLMISGYIAFSWFKKRKNMCAKTWTVLRTGAHLFTHSAH